MMTIFVNGINTMFNLNGGNNVIQCYGFLVGGGEAELLALSGRPAEFEGRSVNDLFLEALKRERQDWEPWLTNGRGDETSKQWIEKVLRIVDNGGKMDILHVVQGTDDFHIYPDLPGYGIDTIFRDEEWLNKAERYFPKVDETGEPTEVRMNLAHNGWSSLIAMETMAHLEMFYDERPSGASQMTETEEEELFTTVTGNIEGYISDEVVPALQEEDPSDEMDVEEIYIELPDRKGWVMYDHGRGNADIHYRPFEEDTYTPWNKLSAETKRNLVTWTSNIIGWEV